MPLNDEVLGTEDDGTKSHEYCLYCYKDGAFTSDCTMEEMAAQCAEFVDHFNAQSGRKLTKEQYHDGLLQYFPTLRRWKPKD